MNRTDILPKKWIVGEKMPCVEGTNIEFKESRNLRGSMATSLAKYRETLTGLLNVGGGYLILGVTDQGIIKGVDESDDDALDKFRVAIDILYGELNYKDGTSLDPKLTSLKVNVFPLENTDRKIIVIEAINNTDILTIQSGGGYLVYRLNASNYRLRSERIYRHRDVQGLVKTVKQKMSLMIEEQHNRHKEILKAQRDKSEKEITDLVKAISDSLYESYRIQSEPTLCERLLNLVCFRKNTF